MKLSIKNKIGILKAQAASVGISSSNSLVKCVSTNNLSKSIRNVKEASDFKTAYQQAIMFAKKHHNMIYENSSKKSYNN